MSSDQAKWYHSITIGEKNTWDNWHLVPSSRPLVAAPSVKTSYVSLPGGDGSLDLTEVLSGRPTYGRRSGSWEFVVMNDYGDWADRYSEIMAYLQGRIYNAVLDDDPDYYYRGRFSVNEWRSEPYYSRIVIDYNLDTYKRSVEGYEWLWDPFNFETGIIHDYRKITVSGTLSITYSNDSMVNVVPTIGSSVNGMRLTIDGTTYTLSKGPNVFYELVLAPGDTTMTFVGNGTVSIENHGGIL